MGILHIPLMLWVSVPEGYRQYSMLCGVSRGSAQVTPKPAATRGDLAALGAAGSSPPRQGRVTIKIIRPCGWDRYPVTRGTRWVARVSDK